MKRMFSCLMMILIIIAGTWLWFEFNLDKENSNPFGDKVFVVETGQGVEQIINNLKSEGFLQKTTLAKAYVRLKNFDSQFKAGSFQLNTKMSVKELISELTRKNASQETITITILEGWTNEQIVEYLIQKTSLNAEEFWTAIDIADYQYEFLIDKPKTADLEGFLYPDTYEIFADATAQEIINKMLDNFNNKLTNELRLEIAKQNKDIFEVLTLASIVEKEMFGYENRRIVAGIFQNRLNDNYPLQSDATVNYITQRGTTRPSLDDTKIDNPYNTYQNAGLTPGPICNPSIEAIKAVIYYADTDYYFFLTTTDNEIVYSRTHEEHIINRNKYLD